ncbi:hypothetical protein IL306_007336 [Fusarium sp. DS 682]|nr:hypothetical protein IL306_007336 [Fusarium sp. DS 682]
MEPKTHDPDLPMSLQPLIDKKESVLEQKMNWAVAKVAALKTRGKRVLIYVKEDSTATGLNEKMRTHGLNTHEVATIWTKDQAGVIAYYFTDPSHEIDALITTFATLKTSYLKFYGPCHHGIILEYPDNIEDYLEATRRLTSIGQTQQVEWFTSYMFNTLDVMYDLTLSRKAVMKLVLDPGMYPGFPADLKLICAFHDVSLVIGQSSSRYPRMRVDWRYMETDEIKREGKADISCQHPISANDFTGLFYSAVAKFLKEIPSSARKFNKDTMARIAQSWKPEQALTMDHVDLKLPEIDEGVVLYNYVLDEHKGHL